MDQAEIETPIKASGSLAFGLAHLAPPANVYSSATRRESIAVTTLERFVAERGIDRFDFIKADIQGWEIRLLRGTMATLRYFRPTVILELVAGDLAMIGSRP